MKILFLGLISLVFIIKIVIKRLEYKNRDAQIPESVKDVYDEKEYLHWKNYKTDNLKLETVELVIEYIFIMLLFSLNIHHLLYNFANKLIDELFLQYLIIFLILGWIGLIYEAFFDYYKTFTIEEKYGFNKTTPKLFVRDYTIKFIFMLLIEAGLMTFLNKVYNSFDVSLFLTISLGVMFFFILIAPFLMKFISKIFNKLTPLPEGSLKDKIIEYITKVKFPIDNVFVVDASKRSTKANAYFTGYGKKRRIVLYDTLIEQLTEEEIVAVLAHEAGHAKRKHIVKLIPFSLLTGLIMLVGIFVLVANKQVSTAFGFEDSNFFFGALLFFEMFPLIAIFSGSLSNYFSRRFEFQADNYAATTYSPLDMVSALKKISKNNLSNLTPHPLTVFVYDSHPPLNKRVEEILKIK